MVQQTSVTGRDKELESGIFLLKQQFFENEISGEQDAESWLQIKQFFAYKFTSARENQQPQIDHIAGGKHTIEWGGPFKGEDINILLTVHPLGVS